MLRTVQGFPIAHFANNMVDPEYRIKLVSKSFRESPVVRDVCSLEGDVECETQRTGVDNCRWLCYHCTLQMGCVGPSHALGDLTMSAMTTLLAHQQR